MLERHSYSYLFPYLFLMVWPTSRLTGGGKVERISRRSRWPLEFDVVQSVVGHDTIILISCPISIGDKCGSMFSRSTEQVGPARLLAVTAQGAGQVPGIMHENLRGSAVWGSPGHSRPTEIQSEPSN